MSRAADFAARYDELIFAPDKRGLYGGDHFNVGWWADGAETLDQACGTLVDQHARCLEHGGAPTGIVLDVGCGLGAGTAALRQRWPEAHVIGLNISPRQARHGKARNPEVSYCAMDALRLGIADGVVEAIVSVEAALHFPSRAAFLMEAWRVLRPGGRLVLTDILGADRHLFGDWLLPAAAAPANPGAYAVLCADHGFRTEQLRDITRETWVGFCSYLARLGDTVDLAAALRSGIGCYVFAVLVKISVRVSCCRLHGE